MSEIYYDEQAGKVVELNPENKRDRIAAIVSIVYLLLMLALFFWQLLDIWIGRFYLARRLGYTDVDRLASPSFILAAVVFIGGGLGGIVNGIRSVLFWHCEKFAFGQRYLWKYISLPWLGSALAIFVYALIRSGIVVFGGEIPLDDASAAQAISLFGVGALAGYGSRDAFKWLDAQVTRLFKVTPASTIRVPDLMGRTRDHAESILKAASLRLGQVSEEPTGDAGIAGTVTNQTPLPEASIASGGSVDITIAIKKKGK